MEMRLQKLLADAGVASRRASEEIIRAGRVTVNGERVIRLGTRVDPERDTVAVDGGVLKARRLLHVAIHKPRVYLCTRKDPQERQVVADLLPAEWNHLYPVGRLDRDSEGLLLLTNDGEFCLRLTHPRFRIRKTYHASIRGRVTTRLLDRLCRGVNHQGEHLHAQRARLRSSQETTSEVELELTEGKYHEVRRLFASQGCEVVRLVRTQIGPIRLGELAVGKWRTLTPAEVKTLLLAV